MTRYRLLPHAVEAAEDGLWVGALPQGPILWVSGIGEQVLEVLAEPAAPALHAEDVVARLTPVLEGMPPDAAEVIADFLEQLAEAGLLRAEPGA